MVKGFRLQSCVSSPPAGRWLNQFISQGRIYQEDRQRAYRATVGDLINAALFSQRLSPNTTKIDNYVILFNIIICLLITSVFSMNPLISLFPDHLVSNHP